MTRILDAVSLCAGYGGSNVLHDVNLRIDDGQAVALIGANGAGKTTFMHVVAGVNDAASGAVTASGVRAGRGAQAALVRAGVVLVPEGRHVFGSMTVDENLLLGAYVRRAMPGRQRDRERVYELFPRLKERLGQLAGTLSGGEQQMLAIGRALMAAPKLLLLDEPTLGLAPLVVHTITQALRTLNGQGLSMLIVEQNANVALGLASFGYLLEQGRISAYGTATELADDQRVRAAYLGREVVATHLAAP